MADKKALRAETVKAEAVTEETGKLASKKYGKIDSSFFAYVTTLMILTVVVFMILVIAYLDKISVYFMHSPPLNSLMLFVVATGLVMAFKNNFILFKTGRFIKQLETTEAKAEKNEEIPDSEIAVLRTDLESKGYLLSMAQFSEILGNLQTFGHLNIRDSDARLVKSKFGSRLSGMRVKVNYLCGVLVMLGLIGTFWGLLATITAVGQAMTKISFNFAEQTGGSAGANINISDFIGSISRPLEGMGVGFSASLFGLTGSLLLGFINYLSGIAHNRFVENFSRWIDDRIPRMRDSLSETIKKGKVPAADDLKSWLAGFVFLSSKMSQRMEQLFGALTKTNETAIRSLHEIEKLHERNQQVIQALESGNRGIIFLRQSLDAAGHSLMPALSMIKNMEFQMTRAGLASDALRQRIDIMNESLQAVSRNIVPSGQTLQNIETGIKDVSAGLTSNAAAEQQTAARQLEHQMLQSQRFEQLAAAMTEMAETQTALFKGMAADREEKVDQAQPPHEAKEIKELVAEINKALTDIRKNTKDGLLHMFEEGAEAEAGTATEKPA